MTAFSNAAALGSFALILCANYPAAADQDTGSHESPPEYLLSLQYEGTDQATPAEYERLYKLALMYLQSSQFNSGKPLWHWDLADTLASYRRAVDGRYLLITYSTPRTIATQGGDITVSEVVLGLNGSQNVTSVHTVDGDGRIVGHAKYNGELGVAIIEHLASMERHLTMRSSGP